MSNATKQPPVREAAKLSNPARRVRVLVAPHSFQIGGSQIHALELAAEIARLPGHEVIVYAPDGELAQRARDSGLELHLSTLRESAPSFRRIRELAALARRRHVDLVHAYEWAPTIDAAYGAAWSQGIPVLSTILSLDYPYFIPPSLPVTMVTPRLRDRAAGDGRTAYLIEASVDTTAFRPDAVTRDAVARARHECGAGDTEWLITVVGRLAERLKLDGLLALSAAVGELAARFPVALAIVGDGPARGQVEAAAAAANRQAGREVVRLLGSRNDPRDAYLAADIVVGMGSSALRALSLERPLVVQGERGFWAVADETSLPILASQDWYGVGDGRDSVENCTAALETLIRATPSRRTELGRWGRSVVEERYANVVTAQRLRDIYHEVLDAAPPSRWQRLRQALVLTRELVKHRTSVRFPWIQAAYRSAVRR